ncbi:hypothetical protein KRX11_04030 [Pasteurellaceae bacterium TAE3-ERU1]|nr:hypothetical protein [Pasteurellaceae bacterium TAE3-ERU1]
MDILGFILFVLNPREFIRIFFQTAGFMLVGVLALIAIAGDGAVRSFFILEGIALAVFLVFYLIPKEVQAYKREKAQKEQERLKEEAAKKVKYVIIK